MAGCSPASAASHGATVAAYAVADVLLTDTVPVIAALTALLVTEATLFDILTAGVQRVVSVVVGVLLAVAFSMLVGISWWSLGLLVGLSIVIGQVLRLGPHLVEVPISAMLVLAVGGEQTVASDRVIETLIGATVGIAVNLAFPPQIRANTAAATVGVFADEIAALLQAELPFFDRPSFRALGEGTIEQRVASTAALLATLNERTWPLDEVWRDAAAFEPDLARQHADREEDRRIQTARALALLTGRPPGPIAADGIWAITGSAVYAKLVNGAGWTRDLYQSWLMSTILGVLDADGRAG